jgi:hypothetical protein
MRLLFIPIVLVSVLTTACGGGGSGGGGDSGGMPTPGGGGGGAGDFGPNQLRFTDITAQAPNTVVVSNALTISGAGTSWAISVSGGEYSVGCGATFTSAAGTIAKGESVCVRHTTSSAYSTRVNTTLTVGGVSDTFSSTTAADGSSLLSTAVMHRGVIGRDGVYAVMNTAISVLDANGNPVYNLDGGNFEILPDGASKPDPELHHDARKLAYPAQVSGQIVLLLDISDSMGPRFTELKTAAKKFVTDAAAAGLPVIVHAFDRDEYVVGSVAGGGDPTALNADIDALALGPSSTYFNQVIAASVADRQGVGFNGISYGHNPPTVPSASVELMVIMSDGRDNSGVGSPSDITTAKDLSYNLVTIPVGDDPDLSGLAAISEFQFKVPTGGTYSDAVTAALTGIQSYYRGLYVVDVAPTVLEGTDKTFTIRLVGNSASTFGVLYHPDASNFSARPVLPAYCCRLRVTPSASLSPLTLPSHGSVTLKAVQLWTSESPPTFDWTLTNADGRLSITPSADSTSARVQSLGGASTGTVDVSEPISGWSNGAVTINVH